MLDSKTTVLREAWPKHVPVTQNWLMAIRPSEPPTATITHLALVVDEYPLASSWHRSFDLPIRFVQARHQIATYFSRGWAAGVEPWRSYGTRFGYGRPANGEVSVAGMLAGGDVVGCSRWLRFLGFFWVWRERKLMDRCGIVKRDVLVWCGCACLGNAAHCRGEWVKE